MHLLMRLMWFHKSLAIIPSWKRSKRCISFGNIPDLHRRKLCDDEKKFKQILSNIQTETVEYQGVTQD